MTRIGNVQIRVDDTEVQSKISEVQNKITQTNEQVKQTDLEMRTVVMMGMHLLSNTLQNVSKVSAAQTLIALQSVITGTINTAQLAIQAAAAYNTGNFVMGSLYTGLAAEMGYSVIQSRIAAQQSKANEQYINSINEQIARYS